MDVATLLQDFTIDGQVLDDEDIDADNPREAFRDILLYVAGERRYSETVGRVG